MREIVDYRPPLEKRKKFLRLDFNENLRGPSPRVINFLRSIPSDEISTYPTYEEAYHTLGKFLGLNPDELLITAGIDDGLRLIFDTLVEKGDRVMLVVPTFTMYKFYGSRIGVKILEVKYEKDFSFPTYELLEQVGIEKPNLLIVADPNNPTGTAIPNPEKLLSEIFSRSPETILVIDEAYGEFGRNSYFNFLRKFPNLIVMRTFSKAYGLSGLRIGYLASNSNLIRRLKKASPPYNVNVIGILAMQEAIKDISYVNNYVEEVREVRDFVNDALSRMGFEVVPSEGNFLLVRFGNLNEWIVNQLKDRGILIRDRSKEKFLNEFSRITIGPKKVMDRFLDDLRSLLEEPVILFDMDGVLVDVRESYLETVKFVVHEFVGEKPSEEEIEKIKQVPGFNNDWNVTFELITRRGVETKFEEVKSRFQRVYLEKPGYQRYEKPLVETDYLNRLKKKYRLGIVTGRPRNEAIKALELFDFDMFQVLISLEDVSEDKPSPEGILKALELLKGKKGYYIGDTINDVIAAKRAKLTPILIGKEKLEGAFCIQTINQLEELL